MKVSIVIPALNEAAGIAQAVARARAARPHEVIVVDGGSDDGTPDVAAACECRVIRVPRGRALQQNAGAAAAEGDVLLFLHADSWLVPEGIEQIQRALAEPAAAGGAFVHRIEAPGALFRLIERGDSLRAGLLGMPYGDQGIFVRRSVFHALGEFPQVPLMEDVLFMRKLRGMAWPLLLPGPVYTSARRWQRRGVVRQTLMNWTILAGERLGVPLARLARLYPTERNGK